jgi:predicted ATPase/DNA-binding SARP family transcriptional activator/DNA-binding CsgD family transcriptional regulator
MPAEAHEPPRHQTHDQPAGHPGALAIALLGGFRVAVAGRVVAADAWPPRRAGDLVKLLALAPGHRLHAEQIMETLWPEAEAGVAARNLQQALHRARHVLEPALRRGSASIYLARTADHMLALAAPGGLAIDTETFRAARAAARRSGAVADLVAAVACYPGDLLPQDAYADWAIRQRELLREAFIALLAELAGRYEQDGQLVDASATLLRLVEADPAHEEARASLMRLYARLGRRYDALRQYQQLRQALRRELDAAPGPATQRLYDTIRAADLSPQPPLLRGEGELQAEADPDASESAPSGSPPRRGEGLGERFPTSFIGRAREIEAIARLLETERLVTLCGTGGSGKTRLAARVAFGARDALPGGAAWVELAPLADGRLVAQTVAAALGVREERGRPLIESLAHEIGDKDLLLVLDNCEHLVEDAATLAAALLRACPRLRLLATSRRPLHLAAEFAWRVPAMAAPDPDDLPPFERLGEYDAIRLFIARAAAARPGFTLTARTAPAVVRICARLDGIPLAIELAAARLRLLSADEVAARLDDALALLASGDTSAPPRQRTLRAVLDWSYDLLGADERTLFRRLAVFAGGWSLDAAEVVGAGDGIVREQVLDLLDRLADASLVVMEERDGRTRHRLLEMVRRYAEERLEASGEREALSRRHAEWSLALAEAAEPHFVSDRLKEWMERLDAERDNLRAALAWVAARGEVALGMHLVGTVWRYWYHRGLFAEGRRLLEVFLEAARTESGSSDDIAPSLARVKALLGMGQISLIQGDLAHAQVASDLGVALARVEHFGRELTIALSIRGGVAEYRGAFQEAETYYRESLEVAQAIGDTWRTAIALSNLGDAARAQGQYAAAAEWFGECLALARRIKDTRGVAMSLTNVGHMALLRGDAREALAPLEESLALFRELKDARGVGEALVPLGHAAYETGQRAWADACFVEALGVFQASGNGVGMVQCLEGLAVYGAQTPEMAARLLAAAASLRETSGMPLEPHRQQVFARATDDLRARLGERDFADAWAIGRALPLDRIIADTTTAAAAILAPSQTPTHPSRSGSLPIALTQRERAVAALVARGHTDKQVGAALDMAERTASKHVANILHKLHLPSRAAIAAWWRAQQSPAS